MKTKPAAKAKDKNDPDGRQVFRSPVAVVVWWAWVLFALGNLVDLAVQGRDHTALEAAFVLLFVTGIVYVTALRPRMVADAEGLTIANPMRQHRVGWAAVAGADPTDLLRIRCEWLDGDATRSQAIYAWAVHSSRRRQFAADMRARRRSQGTRGGGFPGLGSFGWTGGYGTPAPPPERDPLTLDTGHVVATLNARAEQARLAAPAVPAAAPVSTWYWPAVAAVVVPGIALLITALV